MSDLVKKNERKFNLGDFVLDNIVTIIFWVFIILGLVLAKSVTFNWFLTELSNRFYRNAFLVLSLIIPVIAGLGLNFGIVVGAIAGQLAIILVRYYYIGGFGGFLLCMLIALPIAMLFGWLTGTLYNKTRGQEMIASLIVGYFGTGIYMFIVLFLIGGVIDQCAEGGVKMGLELRAGSSDNTSRRRGNPHDCGYGYHQVCP